MLYLGAGCGDDSEGCDPVARTGCDDNQACEVIPGGDPGFACFERVIIKGQVFNFDTDAGIASARVVALDANGTPVSSVAVTDDGGNYTLDLPASRMADGTVIGADVTLRADAAGFEPFPHGVRQAIPVDTAVQMDTDEGLLVQNAATDIALLPAVDAGTGKIHGDVQVPDDHAGVVVVADVGGVGYSAVADREGDYVIFNIPAGAAAVQAYALGVNYGAASVDVTVDGDHEVNLDIADENTGTVTGSIQIVNPEGSAGTTSVVLAITSTFDATVARGEVPPGLRAPPPPMPGNVTGTYTIEGVPAGAYTVLAAFENDDLVRDPDIGIGGTSILDITVTAGATTTVEGFKVTGALDVIGPGAEGPEIMNTATPTFSWTDDSSELYYIVTLVDSYGEVVWTQRVEGVSSGDVSVVYPGDPALVEGMIYQFRAVSYSNADVARAATEDLRGVFQFQP
jgi:hypothetical protein